MKKYYERSQYKLKEMLLVHYSYDIYRRRAIKNLTPGRNRRKTARMLSRLKALYETGKNKGKAENLPQT